MYFEKIEFSIFGAYLSAIINGDYSGLSDDDESDLNDFLDATFREYGSGHWSIDSEEPSFQFDEVSHLMGDCYDCTYNVPKYDDVISV